MQSKLLAGSTSGRPKTASASTKATAKPAALKKPAAKAKATKPAAALKKPAAKAKATLKKPAAKPAVRPNELVLGCSKPRFR
jgi:hypothetical protein